MCHECYEEMCERIIERKDQDLAQRAEACALVCEERITGFKSDLHEAYDNGVRDCAKHIRAMFCERASSGSTGALREALPCGWVVEYESEDDDMNAQRIYHDYLKGPSNLIDIQIGGVAKVMGDGRLFRVTAKYPVFASGSTGAHKHAPALPTVAWAITDKDGTVLNVGLDREDCVAAAHSYDTIDNLKHGAPHGAVPLCVQKESA